MSISYGPMFVPGLSAIVEIAESTRCAITKNVQVGKVSYILPSVYQSVYLAHRVLFAYQDEVWLFGAQSQNLCWYGKLIAVCRSVICDHLLFRPMD